MKDRKIPLRICVVTKEKLPKKDLIRVVRTKEGQILVDEKGKTNGRGAYLKKDLNVFEEAFKKKILDRHLEVEIPVTILEELKKLVK
jgi:uncharacterized protein